MFSPKYSCVAKIVILFLLVGAVSGNASEHGLFSRPSLLDGPGGPKAWLRVRGITVDASLTHFFQGLASGDGDQDMQSGGKGDILLAFDGWKLGLWQGLFMNMHGEAIYGDDANTQGNGTIIPVNTALAFPQLGGSDEELSLTLTQQINEQTMLTLGKFNMLDAAARTPLIGGGGLDTFMNLGLAAPISGVTPAYLLGGLLSYRTDPAAFGLFVYDPHSAQDSDVLKDPFDDGVTFSLSVTVPFQLWGDTSIHRIRGVYSTQDGIDLRDIPQLLLPPEAERELGTRSGYWFFSYAFQHFFFQDETDPSRGWGLFGQLGVSDGNPNPVEWSCFIGIGGNNPLAGRNHDRFGIAYFRYSLSDDLVDGLRPVIRLEDEHGIEAFYDFAVAPWLKITGNLQVIDAALSDNSRSVFLGLRTQVKF
ncbi:MAG: carbohydrate porin [Desulfobacteraceae bacterium]|nr:carbohydrate porin [Desulfobacteraceae bacterium]